MKAVIDTNSWVSGLISASGVPPRVIDAYRFRRFMWVTSDPLLDELATVLLARGLPGNTGLPRTMGTICSN
ncbi:putative toxin-antitoxin system toxin component, PIN family [Kyrpidia tusciae]|uniref:PIN domain-containing protein n=1 Tax=Kyrpidia tusciae (strain DSM 2912 / NBRC 15312 / T2) TaxID=562970 RepID=D5WVL4_KYRT2|nr:putative toxin-antitoxin system toxin component, PIN family [Kyrpidia tusciae]ADG07557.1 hypothetical protein Btus_2921 [Kyrpidia tusciae DSM 2912]